MTLSLTDHQTIKQAKVESIKNYMTGEAFTIGKLGNDIKFVIQSYQREYEWDENNISDLLHTIFKVDLTDDSDNSDELSTEIGSVIIQPIDENIVSILDGQQRTTTITLICLYLEQLLSNTIAKVENSEREKLIKENRGSAEIRNIIKKKMMLHDEHFSILKKMFLDVSCDDDLPKISYFNFEKYDDFFKLLIRHRKEVFDELCLNRSKKITSSKILKILNQDDQNNIKIFDATLNALYHINEFFRDELDIEFDKDSKINISKKGLNEISKYINNLFNVFITIEVFSVKMNPSIIFQNRNNKGKGLDALELIKNSFIVADANVNPSCKHDSEINKFIKNLKSTIKDRKNVEKYIFSMFRVLHPETTKEHEIISIDKLTLFFNNSGLRQKEWKYTDTNNFFKSIKDYAFKYKKIKGIEPTYPEATSYIYILQQLFLIDLYLPILLKYYPDEKSEKEKKFFVNILKDILKMYFTAIFNGKNNFYINNNAMKIGALSSMMDEMNNGKSLYDFIFDRYLFKDVDEQKIVEKWEDFTFEKVNKGILYLYELSLRFTDIENFNNNIMHYTLSKTINVEHIIPVKHKHNIPEIPKDIIGEIGNLLLLDKDSNEKASNEIFEIKKEKIYKKQINELKQIEEIVSYNSFKTKEDIKLRTDRIVNSIYKFLLLV